MGYHWRSVITSYSIHYTKLYDDIVDVAKGTLEVKVKGAGTVEPMSDDTVFADAAGIVKDVLFEDGDVVSADDIIAVLESDALESEKSSSYNFV